MQRQQSAKDPGGGKHRGSNRIPRTENCFRKSHRREARRADVTTRQGCQSSFANRALFIWPFYSPEPAGVSGCRLAREADEVANGHLPPKQALQQRNKVQMEPRKCSTEDMTERCEQELTPSGSDRVKTRSDRNSGTGNGGKVPHGGLLTFSLCSQINQPFPLLTVPLKTA